MRSQDKEVLSAVRQECEVDFSNMQQQLVRLDRQSRVSNLVIHAPTACSRQQLMDRCNAVLRSARSDAVPMVSAALQPVRTRSTTHAVWRLQLHDREAKHVMFHHSSSFRHDHIYMDDDLTTQQLDGRRSLMAHKLQLKQDGKKTWWRRDVLHWADHEGVHRQRPS